jgi:NAD(P)-dependent dehydrogenase (short-subunit alcohol dehydrogenase family)
MKVAGPTALVTGANRGLGLAFAKVLVEMEAAKVYAAARNPEAVTLMGVVPLKLDCHQRRIRGRLALRRRCSFDECAERARQSANRRVDLVAEAMTFRDPARIVIR